MTAFWDVLDDLLDKRPLSFTVLVLFILDSSHSMTARRTFDRRQKFEHLVESVKLLLNRLENSSMAPMFRVGFVWFNDDVMIAESGGKKYFPVEEGVAYQVFEKSIPSPLGKTAIADALEGAARVVEDYISDNTLPEEKYVTMFLFTDGKETKKTEDDVILAANRIHGELQDRLRELDQRNRIGLATIAMGRDADRETLRAIASFLRDAQRKVLRERGLLDLVDPPYHEKLFIDAPQSDRITREWLEAVRRFVERLSETAVY